MDHFTLTDEEIASLLNVKKVVTNPRAQWREQKGSKQKSYKAKSLCGKEFIVYLRQNLRIEEAFSCGLKYCHPEGKDKDVTLCRYNGSDHEHENPLDGKGTIINQCHIHKATQRYMAAGRKAEHYAESTERYESLHGALLALCSDCSIEFPGQAGPLSEVHDDMWGGNTNDDD
ncbi:DUF6978 family protein [Halomonas salipaludis]|uniref:DUF6978 family protein n=1 Tax=Halomonas salipaludis TaxID=2032625 RepID=UPI0015957ED5|nr:hypothetical protein [Halomonas salipaludis]